MTTSSVPLGRARTELAELCSRVAYGGERIVLTRHGKPGAVLVSVQDLQSLDTQLATAALMAEESIEVAAEVAKVWLAIFHMRDRALWWPLLTIEAYEGGTVVDNWSREKGFVRNVIDERLIQMTWSDGHGDVEFRLEPLPAGTRITFAYATPRLDAAFWRGKLDALRDYVDQS